MTFQDVSSENRSDLLNHLRAPAASPRNSSSGSSSSSSGSSGGMEWRHNLTGDEGQLPFYRTSDANQRRVNRSLSEVTKPDLNRLFVPAALMIRIDPRSHLEVNDKRHRYAKNLRLYYAEWRRLGSPTGDFFSWLDMPQSAAQDIEANPAKTGGMGAVNPGDSSSQASSSGEMGVGSGSGSSSGSSSGSDHNTLSLPACPRAQLERETVIYCSDEERRLLALSIGDGGLLFDVKGEPLDTGADDWIFVLRDDTLYAHRKVGIRNPFRFFFLLFSFFSLHSIPHVSSVPSLFAVVSVAVSVAVSVFGSC
jgi:hypothetical protein